MWSLPTYSLLWLLLWFHSNYATCYWSSSCTVSGEDFDSSAHSVRFESCQDIHCVDIDIVDNEQLEGTEAFSISLLGNGLDENIIVQPSAGVVVIHDDDSR